MDSATTYELIGYVASALIVLSLLMASVLRLRIVNLVGAVVFTVYGVLIASAPVVVANAAIVVIDVYHLARLLRDRSGDGYFEVLEVTPGSPLLRRFLTFHAEDIRTFQPGFPGLQPDHLAWWVLRDAVPVGVLLGRLVPGEEPAADGRTLQVDLDHVTAAHRDFVPGTVLFGGSRALQQHGITRVVSDAGSSEHRRYLERMGFRDDGDRFRRDLPPADGPTDPPAGD